MTDELRIPLDFDAEPVRLDLEFGSDRIGLLHQERVIRFENTGNKPLRLTDVILESNAGSAAAFIYDFEKPIALARNASGVIEITFRPVRRGSNRDVLVVHGENKGEKQVVARIGLSGEGHPVSSGEIYLCNVNLPFMFPEERADQPTIVLGHHYHVVVSSDEANHALDVQRFTAVPIRDERAGQEWRTSWGLIPLEEGDAVLSEGWIQGFQLFTLPAGYPVVRYPWGTLKHNKLMAVKQAIGELLSEQDPYAHDAIHLREHWRHKPTWPVSERMQLDRWDVVLVRLECLTPDGKEDIRPYIVVSHTVVNNRWERNIATFLPTKRGEHEEITEKGFLVWTDEGELGCPGEWLVMCNEPRSLDSSFIYSRRKNIPKEMRMKSFFIEKLEPNWAPETRQEIDSKLARYLGWRN